MHNIGNRVASFPQTNGLTERFNQTLCRSLSKLVNDSHSDWDLKLQTILFAYRVSKQKSTGYSPFFMMYHRQPRLPVDIELMPGVEEGIEEQHVDTFVENMIEIRDNLRAKAGTNIAKAQTKQKEYYDSRHSPEVYIISTFDMHAC